MSTLTLTLRQPAQIGDKARSDFVRSTLDYLPGTVVRGAFAAAWIARHGVSEPGTPGRAGFLRLFEGDVRYGALLPVGAQFMPLSVVSHKYPASDDCPETDYDRAVHEQVPVRCPMCGSPFEQSRPGGRARVNRRTSVVIGPSDVAARGGLVTRDALEAGQSFAGTLIASEPELLDDLAALGTIRVGGRRTTQGAADVTISSDASPPTAERRPEGRLIIRLRSPGIFVDDHGRPAADPNPAELESVLGCPATVVKRWTRWQAISGWHIASGLPKPADLAVATGSTYLIEPASAVSDSALGELGRRGLGLRRHEGFGDLAPPPVLAPGRAAREAEHRRRRRLVDDAAPLRGLQVRPAVWAELLHLMTSYATGNQQATNSLRQLAGRLDPRMAAALANYLSLPLDDAAYIAEELRGS
ncbi:MAG TPA: type III-B CRISPR module-associated Cmr3 family protein [Streptosporangiaceae bacterium]|nr:type III-B CRISPR module-associated Cmr3 family protein [Streptosporangiaceae bacterium]